MVPRKVGWHFIDQPLPQPGVEGVHVLAMTPRLPDGSLLIVGEDMERSEAIRDAVFGAILTAGGIALVFGIIAGLFATRQTLRQLKRINVTVRAVERGDLSARTGPPVDARTHLDHLKIALDPMIHRINTLATPSPTH